MEREALALDVSTILLSVVLVIQLFPTVTKLVASMTIGHAVAKAKKNKVEMEQLI